MNFRLQLNHFCDQSNLWFVIHVRMEMFNAQLNILLLYHLGAFMKRQRYDKSFKEILYQRKDCMRFMVYFIVRVRNRLFLRHWIPMSAIKMCGMWTLISTITSINFETKIL